MYHDITLLLSGLTQTVDNTNYNQKQHLSNHGSDQALQANKRLSDPINIEIQTCSMSGNLPTISVSDWACKGSNKSVADALNRADVINQKKILENKFFSGNALVTTVSVTKYFFIGGKFLNPNSLQKL